MPRITNPFRRHSDSWFVHNFVGLSGDSQQPVSDGFQQSFKESSDRISNRQQSTLPTDSETTQIKFRQRKRVRFWELLRLLLWKNFKLLVRNKLSTTAELLLPLLFTLLIVAIRFFGAETKRFDNETIFDSFEPNSLPGIVSTCCNQIYYTPNSPVITRLMEQVQRRHFSESNHLRYSFTGFKTEEELLQAYANSSAGMYAETEDGALSSTVLAGVIFTSEMKNNGTAFPDNIEYSLRFPAALRSQSGLLGERFTFGMKQAWFTEILYPIIQPFGPRAKDQSTGGEPGYFTEGFLYLQSALEKELLNQLAPNVTDLRNSTILLQRFPYPAYIDDEFLVVLQPFLPLTLILSFIYTVTSISKTLSQEKEKRIHESMKMMGLTNALHWTAWFITFLTMFTLSILAITVLLKVHLPDSSKSAGLAVLPKSSPTLIFFCFFVHGFQLISFCFFVSSIFKTSNAASITAAVVWFMLFLPFPFLQPRYSILSSRVKILWSLLTNMGVCFCCQVFCMFEGSQEGAQWRNLFQGVTPDDGFSIGSCVLVMLFNGAVYFIAAVYVSIVWPGEFGVGREWYFFLKKSFWLQSSTGPDEAAENDYRKESLSEFYERVPKSLEAGIHVENLSKEFSEVKAINCLTLTMYKNETFCLLGKNGAGKSTLVSILTGLYQPTSGNVFVNKQNIRTEMENIRQSLGVCPQHNVLFDELTIEEHLEFFSALKGMRGRMMRDEVNRMLVAVGLTHKRKAQVKLLSGGMKRRLCVGIAFCGGSEVVILDEPTSGLDVEARRAIWDLIDSEKVGRTVLLTTHFMEEAELLADRIAIVVSGGVKCVGTCLHLHKKYNGGYNLTIVMEEEGRKNGIVELTNFIQSYLTDANLIRCAGKELTYALPQSESTEFHVLFDAIEREKARLGIETYGARLTSMEDIFIRVNSEEENGVREPIETETKFVNESKSKIQGYDGVIEVGTSERVRNKSAALAFQQFYAMIVKKGTYVWRRRGLFMGQVLVPMGYLSLVLVVLRTVPGIFDPPPHRFQLDHYELFGKTVTPLHCSGDPHCISFAEMFKKMFNKAFESIPSNSSLLNALIKKQSLDIAAFNSKYIIGIDTNVSSRITGLFNNQPLHTPPLALNALTNVLLAQFRSNHTVHVTNHPFPYTNLDTQDTGTYWTVGFHVGYNTAFALTFVVAVFATFLVKEDVVGARQLQRISGLHPAIYWISNFIVDFTNYLFPCAGLLFIFAVFSESIGFLSWSLQGYLLVLFLSFGWALIPLVYVLSHGFKVPAVGFAGVAVANSFAGFVTILTITVLELPQINLVDLALTLHRIFLIFPTYALARGITQMSINKKLQEKCAGFNLEFLCDAAPDSFCCVKLKEDYLDWNEVGIGKNVVYMICVGILSIVTLVLIECNVFTRLIKVSREVVSSEGVSSCQEIKDDDDDVKLERQRVARLGVDYSETLVIKDLTKSYGSLRAVDRLTFGINEGECFGLLGTNGAGKTSTFKMLVGELRPDLGDAFISSFSVTNQRRKTHKLIGYCPQFDALLGELTGRETLTMFARLRGVKEKEICQIVESIARELVFHQYLDRVTENYSGGNKRKLSTAVALIGNPKVVFLDEPTAGMDPMARRHVWSAISSRIRNKQSCVVLTSHSLEECEVLCSRIAILKKGRIKALGCQQKLKHKFGDGFSLVVQIKGHVPGENKDFKDRLQRKFSNTSQLSSSTQSSLDTTHSMQVVDNYLRSHFPPNTECVLTSSHANYLHYHLKQQSAVNSDDQNSVTWSSLFRTLENCKESVGISAYSISQITLEQVFLSV